MGTYHSEATFDVLDMVDISCVLDWWNKETHVSPNKSNVTKKFITPKIIDEHATHLLLDVIDGNAMGFIHLNVHP
jgi:hypothetical protein